MRLYGICLLSEKATDTATLVVRASSIQEATRTLHANYNIEAVLDVLTEEQANERRRTMRQYTEHLKGGGEA